MNIWKRYSMRVSKNWVKFNKMFTLSPWLIYMAGFCLHSILSKHDSDGSGIQIISATLMDEWREVANC